MVSLKDVAQELGLSVGFVSKVLSGRMGVSSVSRHTRKRILKKADEMGYVPNRNAIRFFTGKKDTLGLFIHPWGERGSDLVHDFLFGATKALMPTVYQTWLNLYEEASEFYHQVPLREVQQRVDGMMVGGAVQSWVLPQLRKLKKAQVPIVTFFQEAFPGVVNVCVDYYQQGRLPTEHLLAGNCRKIVNLNANIERHRGYADALLEAGLKVKPEYVLKCKGFGIECGRAAVRKLLKSKTSFDGIVAQSDHQALGVVQELQIQGIRVPGDVRVTGVDDSPICETSFVPLTSVTSECRRMGTVVIDTMLNMIAGEPVKSCRLLPKVVARSSG